MIGIPHSTVGLMSPALGEIDHYVRAFETPGPFGPAAIEAFLPPPKTPFTRTLPAKLIRIDMEVPLGMRSGDIDDYRRAVPAAFRDPATVAAVAFEEFRQRREHGEEPDPGEYARDYGSTSPIG